jgi:ATP-dependent RNA helicase SUPV3L1/SUV3
MEMRKLGLGLNLPIRRVLFSTPTKYDGQADRRLEVGEVHQIAGRAGRYGMHEEGFVSVLAEAEPTVLHIIKDLLPRTPEAPIDFKAPVAPNSWHIATISQRLNKTALREVLGVFMEQLKMDDTHFAVAELEQMLELAEALDQRAGRLTLKERFTYAQAPVDTRTEGQVDEFLSWSHNHAAADRAGKPWFLELRFPNVYGHLDEVLALRSSLNDGIERHLKGKRALAQQRRPRR